MPTRTPQQPRLPCKANPELFFPISDAGLSLRDISQAKALCHTCPARAACLRGALARVEPAGIWGGVLFPQPLIGPRRPPAPPEPQQKPKKFGGSAPRFDIATADAMLAAGATTTEAAAAVGITTHHLSAYLGLRRRRTSANLPQAS